MWKDLIQCREMIGYGLIDVFMSTGFMKAEVRDDSAGRRSHR